MTTPLDPQPVSAPLPSSDDDEGELYVAMSQFEVANDLDDAVEAAFLQRPHLVDDVDGFVRMEVMRDVEAPRRFWLLTWWRDLDSYRSWHRGHSYKSSHVGIPQGLKLVKGSARVHLLRRFAR